MSTDAKVDGAAEAAPGNGPPLISSSKASDEKGTGVLATNHADEDFAAEALRGPNGEEYPTARELETLRRVKGPIGWLIYTIAFIELCERFAYYGTNAVCMCLAGKDRH